MHSERLIRLPEVEAKTGLKRASIYAAAQKGNFPRPIKISARASAWRESEVAGWIASRLRDSGRTDVAA
jgi:prophage regulatory protein